MTEEKWEMAATIGFEGTAGDGVIRVAVTVDPEGGFMVSIESTKGAYESMEEYRSEAALISAHIEKALALHKVIGASS